MPVIWSVVLLFRLMTSLSPENDSCPPDLVSVPVSLPLSETANPEIVPSRDSLFSLPSATKMVPSLSPASRLKITLPEMASDALAASPLETAPETLLSEVSAMLLTVSVFPLATETVMTCGILLRAIMPVRLLSCICLSAFIVVSSVKERDEFSILPSAWAASGSPEMSIPAAAREPNTFMRRHFFRTAL